MSTNRGVFEVSKKALNEVADGKARSVTCRLYTKSDGLRSNECNGGVQPAGWRARDGKLWFPTTKGLAMIDPSHIQSNAVPPPVSIERVTVDGEPLGLGSHPRLAPGPKNMEFDYTGLSFQVPDKVRFKYRLLGLSSDWISAGTRRTAYYNYLPPGTYKFEVLACNEDDLWSRTSSEFSFEVTKPVWSTWWFRFMVVLALMAVAYSISLLRHSAQLKREKERMQVFTQVTLGLLHEARQPLQVVTARLDLLALLVTSDELRKPLEEAYSGVNRVVGLFQKLEKIQSRGSYRTAPYATHDKMMDITEEPT